MFDLDDSSSQESAAARPGEKQIPIRFKLNKKTMKYFGITENDLVIKGASLRTFVNYVKSNKNLSKFTTYL